MYFQPVEYLPKELYNIYGDAGLRYIDKRIPIIMEITRSYMNKPITINNHHIGGLFNESCLRILGHKAYLQWSCHSFGRAVDFRYDGLDSKEFEQFIIKGNILTTNLKENGLTAIEVGNEGWIHFAVSDFTGWNIPQENGLYLIPANK